MEGKGTVIHNDQNAFLIPKFSALFPMSGLETRRTPRLEQNQSSADSCRFSISYHRDNKHPQLFPGHLSCLLSYMGRRKKELKLVSLSNGRTSGAKWHFRP